MSFPKKLLVLLLCATVGAGEASAQSVPPGVDESFPVDASTLLLPNTTGAVVRLDSRRFVVKNPGEARLHVRRAVTVLAPKGREYGRVAVHYDTFRKIDDLDGRLLDAAGEEVRDLESSDVEDFSAISDYSLYEENRIRTAVLYHDAYPYTVVFEYEVDFDGLISWPMWVPQPTTAPVEHTVFEIDTPPTLPARYAAHQADALEGVGFQPEVTRSEGRRVYRWNAAGLPPRTPEPHSPSWQKRTPRVFTAPAVFEIEGRRGTMDTWEDFGQWYHDLNATAAEAAASLPPEVQEEVRALVEPIEGRREKVRRLYRYMQRRTRYVSVQLGIGGWKAFSPAYVHEHGYGDCKALVHFMQALLHLADIESHPALLTLGRRTAEVPTGLPSNQFNHVILAVPMEDEAEGRLWLECTSQTAPFAHLGAAGEDRHALLVKDGASTLVRISPSTAIQNTQHRRATVTLTEEGAAVAELETRYAGNQQDRVRGRYGRRSAPDRHDLLREQADVPNVEILEADFSDTEARRDTVALPLRLRLRGYAARTGPRLFFRPNLMSRWKQVPPPSDEARTQPVAYFSYPFVDTDTLDYALPEGFAVEAMPEPVEIETPFARYEASLDRRPNGGLQYRRRVEVRTAELPPEQYDAFRAFLQKVARADRAQVVLVKK